MHEITVDDLESAGWTRIAYSGGILIEYWKTIRPLWTDPTKRRSHSLRVRFQGPPPPKTAESVTLCVGNCLLPLPRVRTMKEIEQLLKMITEGD